VYLGLPPQRRPAAGCARELPRAWSAAQPDAKIKIFLTKRTVVPAPYQSTATPGSLTAGAAGKVDVMTLAQRRVLILAADDFEDMELLYPLYRLIEEEVGVTVAGLDDHPVRGKKGYGPLPVHTTVAEVDEADFDALVIPGGYAPDKLRRSEAVLDLVRAFDEAGKPIAFICHAGWVPISAKIIKGRRATSVAAIRDDMINAGADWVDEPTVVDGHLISARTPADLGPWMKALLRALETLRAG
jgi:protease I